MPRMIEAGEDGSLLVPSGAAGPVPLTAAMVVLVVVITVFPLAVSLMASSPSIRGHKTKAETLGC